MRLKLAAKVTLGVSTHETQLSLSAEGGTVSTSQLINLSVREGARVASEHSGGEETTPRHYAPAALVVKHKINDFPYES
jgi:hypothetical protein